jgi:hypothetical protein
MGKSPLFSEFFVLFMTFHILSRAAAQPHIAKHDVAETEILTSLRQNAILFIREKMVVERPLEKHRADAGLRLSIE